jgi:hypothetical protein
MKASARPTGWPARCGSTAFRAPAHAANIGRSVALRVECEPESLALPAITTMQSQRLVFNRPSSASLIFIGSIPHSQAIRRTRRELSCIYHGEVARGWNWRKRSVR